MIQNNLDKCTQFPKGKTCDIKGRNPYETFTPPPFLEKPCMRGVDHKLGLVKVLSIERAR